MEVITRARTHLSVILVEEDKDDGLAAKTRDYFQQAADQGLIKIVLRNEK